MMATMLESEVELTAGMAFRARSGSGDDLRLDASADAGGTGSGMRPIELVLLALGGCTGMDVISILRKMRQDVAGYRVRVRGERRAQHPMIFTGITVEHVVTGRNVNPEAVRRAVDLSVHRYCSVSAMLAASVPIAVTYRVIDEASGAETAGSVASVASARPSAPEEPPRPPSAATGAAAGRAVAA
jgi:putative redox protein